MPRKKLEIARTRINLAVSPEAADLLARLAPSENKRGAYVEELIRRAAGEAGLIAAPAGEEDGEIADVRRRLRALEDTVDTLARQRAPGAEPEG